MSRRGRKRLRSSPANSSMRCARRTARLGTLTPSFAEHARRSLDRLPRHQAECGRGAVSAARHHLRRLWRRRLDRAADPLRPHSANSRPLRMGPGRARLHPAGQGDQRLSLRHLSRSGDHQGRPRAAGTRAAQLRRSGPEMHRGRPAQQGLCPYRRHRSDPHRRARFLRARGQCPHAVRRFLRAREPRDHDAALSRCLCRAEHLPGRQLP